MAARRAPRGCACDRGRNKTTFVRKANAICEATRQKIPSEGIRVFRKISPGKSRSQAADIFLLRWLVPTIEAEIEEVRALGAPSGDEAEVSAILDELQSVLNEAKANPNRYREEQAHFSLPYQTAEELALEYGIGACGHP